MCGEHHTVTAFRLAGLKRAYELHEATARLSSMLADASVGVIIMTKRFAQQNRAVIAAHRSARKTLPIIITIPEFAGPAEKEADEINALVKRAIGADLKKR